MAEQVLSQEEYRRLRQAQAEESSTTGNILAQLAQLRSAGGLRPVQGRTAYPPTAPVEAASYRDIPAAYSPNSISELMADRLYGGAMRARGGMEDLYGPGRSIGERAWGAANIPLGGMEVLGAPISAVAQRAGEAVAGEGGTGRAMAGGLVQALAETLGWGGLSKLLSAAGAAGQAAPAFRGISRTPNAPYQMNLPLGGPRGVGAAEEAMAAGGRGLGAPAQQSINFSGGAEGDFPHLNRRLDEIIARTKQATAGLKERRGPGRLSDADWFAQQQARQRGAAVEAQRATPKSMEDIKLERSTIPQGRMKTIQQRQAAKRGLTAPDRAPSVQPYTRGKLEAAREVPPEGFDPSYLGPIISQYYQDLMRSGLMR